MTIEDHTVTFARNFLGDEFCAACYKNALGLTNQRDADRAIVDLAATRKFKLEPGQCKKCGRRGIMLRAVQHR